MPSVDVIRNITIKGKADGVDDATAALNRLTDSIKAANENLAKNTQAANDNSGGFRLTGEGALSAANHLRQAAEAAYAFSPAFRGVVNELAVPVLQGAGTALAAVASGMVTATNAAGTGLITLAAAAEKTAPQFLGLTSYVRSAGLAMEAFAPTATSVAGSVLARFIPLVGQIILVYDAVKLLGAAWTLAGQQLETYNAISNNAIGVSTEFYQRITKAAEAAKLPVDDLTAALKEMNKALTPKLGGSEGINRLDELTKAGNFGGNSGVAQLKGATGTQEQLAAMINLIKQAGDASERLAAIDLAKTVFGSTIADNLSKDYDYLDKIQQKAAEISGKDIISDADVARAVQIQARFDAAYKTLSERWHPLQEILTDLGTRFKLEWLSFLEAVAAVANAFEKAYNWAARLAAVGFDSVKQGLRQAAGLQGTQYGPLDDSVGTAQDRALDRLRSGLSQPNQVRRSTDDLNSIYNSIRGDRSKDPNKKADEEDTSAYDRAEESLLKYIETTKAASLSVSDAAAEQEKFRAIAQLTAAGMKDGLTPEAARLKAEMSGLGEQAGAAADALARARAVSQIEFGSKTAFLSQSDVAIAQQLKSIYGNDIPAALNSTYAAGIRVNNAFREISSGIETSLVSGLSSIADGSVKAGQAFSNMGLSIVRAIEQMIIKLLIVGPLMKSLQDSITGSGGIAGLLGLGGAPGTAGSPFYGPVAPSAQGNVFEGSNIVPFARGGIVDHPTLFRFASGAGLMGEAGPEAIVPLRRGPDGNLGISSTGGGSVAVNVNVENHNGSDVSVNQRKNDSGGVDLIIAVRDAVNQNIASGQHDKAFGARFGARPGITPR